MFPGPDFKPIVLCIDDNATALGIRKKVLENGGFNVVTAGSAPDAFEVFKSWPVDVVLSDHCLKGSTGVEIARHMKELTPSVPVVLYSGTPPAVMGPVDCFILKTEPPEYLLACLRDLVERSHS